MFLIDEGIEKPLVTEKEDDALLKSFCDKVLPLSDGKLDLTKLADEIREFIDQYHAKGGSQPMSSVVIKTALTKASQAIHQTIEETKKPSTIEESKLNIALTLLARSGLVSIIPNQWATSLSQFVCKLGGFN